MNDLEARAVNYRGLIRVITAPGTSDPDRWLSRLALLELAGVEPTIEALAFIGNTTVEKAMGAMAVLRSDGRVEHREG